jgi:hypothetical protein
LIHGNRRYVEGHPLHLWGLKRSPRSSPVLILRRQLNCCLTWGLVMPMWFVSLELLLAQGH